MAEEPTAWKSFTESQWATWTVGNWDNFLLEVVTVGGIPLYFTTLFTEFVPTKRGPHVQSS